MLEIPQSIPLCLVFSATGGVIEVLATAVLAYQDEQVREGNAWCSESKWAYRGALSANVFLQVTASMFGNLLAPWFGPVSLVGPIFLSAQVSIRLRARLRVRFCLAFFLSIITPTPLSSSTANDAL